MARWQEQVRAAQLSGAVPPEPPTPIVVPGDSFVFHAERSRLREAERGLLAERADEYEAVLAEREGELLAEVREITGRLDAIAGEIAELTATAQSLRAASGSPTPVYGGSLTARGWWRSRSAARGRCRTPRAWAGTWTHEPAPSSSPGAWRGPTPCATAGWRPAGERSDLSAHLPLVPGAAV